MIEQVCLICGKQFVIEDPRKQSQKYCSKECATEAKNKWKREHYVLKRRARKVELESVPKSFHCRMCGLPTVRKNPFQKYCDDCEVLRKLPKPELSRPPKESRIKCVRCGAKGKGVNLNDDRLCSECSFELAISDKWSLETDEKGNLYWLNTVTGEKEFD